MNGNQVIDCGKGILKVLNNKIKVISNLLFFERHPFQCRSIKNPYSNRKGV